MSNSEYKHYDTEDEFLSLHDCNTEKVLFENGILSFYFENGFWITPEHKSSNLEQTVRTDFAKVDFHLAYGDEGDITIYVFSKKAFGKVIREEWKLNKLINAINSGSCRLEFLYQYKGYNELIIECCLWFDKKPYYKECQLKISETEVVYCWNNLCEDKIW